MARLSATRFWLLPLLALLAACGNTTTPAAVAPTARPPAATTAAAPTAQPPAATAATAPTAAIAPTAANGIPEGATPEGYHVRGRADAPVTLVMYSDFL